MSLLPLVSRGNGHSTGKTWRPTRLQILSIITLGVVLAFILYRRELERDAYSVVEVSFNDSEHHQHSSISTNIIPVSTDIDSELTRQPSQTTTTTTTTAKPTPTTILNNHATYPKLDPLAPQEVSAMRERHLKTIDEVIAGGLTHYGEYNRGQLRALKEYWSKVVDEQPKVILSTYGYVPCAISLCGTTGEVVWLESLMNSFRENDQFLLYTGYRDLNKAYKMLGDVVTHVWSTDTDVIWCLNDTISCIESPENPDGVPPWKLFTFTFWGSPRGWQNFFGPKEEPWSYNPLGGEWNLVSIQAEDLEEDIISQDAASSHTSLTRKEKIK
ncbi:hypothetical protein PM082_010904 [Marasmius tenuissimus]|nr:hypothetical protein PM082_010904 [Marasmius tenuissimus]